MPPAVKAQAQVKIDPTKVETKSSARSKDEKNVIDPETFEYMQTLLKPKDREPLTLAHLKALPAAVSQFKQQKAQTKFMPNRSGKTKKTHSSSSSDTNFSESSNESAKQPIKGRNPNQLM